MMRFLLFADAFASDMLMRLMLMAMPRQMPMMASRESITADDADARRRRVSPSFDFR